MLSDSSQQDLLARLDGAAELAESGALSLMEPDEAFASIAAASPAEVPGVADAMTDMYIGGAFARWRDDALASAAGVQGAYDADAAPALCRAAGVPVEAFGEMAASPSLMADAYSAFLDSL